MNYYTLKIISYSDYYPFGMLMSNRHGQDDDYRYGFNGMEKDDEVRGTKGASYDFGARMLDPRIGRWLSVDPLEYQYIGLSPYAFVANTPIIAIDPDGKRIKIVGSRQYRRAVKKHLRVLMRESTSARALIKEAMKSDRIIHIYSPKDKNGENMAKSVMTGYIENDARIQFNLETASSTLKKAGEGETDLEATNETTLAHELFHSVQIITGQTNYNYASDPNNPNIPKIDPSSGEAYTESNRIDMDEVEAVEFENKVRAEMGMELRYYYQEKYTNFKVINKKLGTKRSVLIDKTPVDFDKYRKYNKVLSSWEDKHEWQCNTSETNTNEKLTKIPGTKSGEVDYGNDSTNTTELKR